MAATERTSLRIADRLFVGVPQPIRSMYLPKHFVEDDATALKDQDQDQGSETPAKCLPLHVTLFT